METAQSPSSLYHPENDSDLSYYPSSNMTGPMVDEPEHSTFNLRLIEAVRNSRCLYDAKDRQYRSPDHKIKVWNRLVQILQFDGDARTLYNRWKQLRDKYGKEKKKMKYNGDHPVWQYFKHLTFLDPHMVDRQQQQFTRAKDGKASQTIHITDPMFPMNLIHEVKQHPCLYDIRDPKYRHSDCRNQAWTEIIKHLDFPGDINAIYKQWKKVRDRYVREKRKMRMSATGGGDADDSQWDLFPQMQWIDPFLDDRATHVKRKRDSEDLSDDGYFDEKYDTSHQGATHHSISHVHSPYTTLVIPSDSHREMKPVAHLHQQVSQNPQASQHRIAMGHLTTNSIIQLQDMSACDPDKSFALSVIGDMRALPEHARAVAKAQIQNWMDGSRLAPQVQFEVK
ncbi:hypothetical protein AB6A40_010787 [Gnathostoma spinigerum]|uniref:MADF domain-containing protein n=1 Tax=Gnathostoma spinigerum TaxID=75299 RepID=A0ABD6EWD1_9BILA